MVAPPSVTRYVKAAEDQSVEGRDTMGYLFWGLGDHRPRPNGRPSHISQHSAIEQADKAVLADFITLQSIWRTHGKQRSRSGTALRQERQAWKHLIQHLTDLPPPP
jgi:hypothetical protein